MVARRMRRRFLGAKRPTNAAMTTSATPRMRMVEGEAYPSHCRARGLGAGKANGSCESICCETITAPAPAATAAAALVCSCWSWMLRGGTRGDHREKRAAREDGLLVEHHLERIDVVELADLQVVAAERGDLLLHLVDEAGLEVVQVDAGSAPIELLQLGHHGPRREVPGDVRQPLHVAGEGDLQE